MIRILVVVAMLAMTTTVSAQTVAADVPKLALVGQVDAIWIEADGKPETQEWLLYDNDPFSPTFQRYQVLAIEGMCRGPWFVLAEMPGAQPVWGLVWARIEWRPGRTVYTVQTFDRLAVRLFDRPSCP